MSQSIQDALTEYHKLGAEISYSFGGWKSKVKAMADSASGEARFLVHRQPSSHCVLPWLSGQRRHWGSFIRTLIPFVIVLPSRHNYLLKACLLTPSHWGVRISTQEFEGDINIRSMAYSRYVCRMEWNNMIEVECIAEQGMEVMERSRRTVVPKIPLVAILLPRTECLNL